MHSAGLIERGGEKMDIYQVLAYIGLGCILGIVGQGVRVIVGIKKHFDQEVPEIEERKKELNKREKELDEKLNKAEQKDKEILIREKELILKEKESVIWFSWNQLIISLIISFIVGGIAGILVSIGRFEKEITTEFIMIVIGAGYAGTDFIEGFIKTKLPK